MTLQAPEDGPAFMFRPPTNRSMRLLDRSFFQKKIPLAAARILDTKHISRCRTELSKELLKLERVTVVRPYPGDLVSTSARKALLLRPDIKPEGVSPCSNSLATPIAFSSRSQKLIDSSTWTSTLLKLVEDKLVSVAPYTLDLNYDYWTYRMFIMFLFALVLMYSQMT